MHNRSYATKSVEQPALC